MKPCSNPLEEGRFDLKFGRFDMSRDFSERLDWKIAILAAYSGLNRCIMPCVAMAADLLAIENSKCLLQLC